MAVVQNLYQIFKLPASMLVKHNCSIQNYTVSRGLKEENVVSIGDNLVFQQLRYLHGDTRDHRELFSYVTKLRNNVHIYKKQGKYKEARILEQRISDVLFVKDIVNVVVDGKKSDFDHFRIRGFDFNGQHYVYLCSGSGQIRRNTATFVNEQYRDISVLWVRTPRVCVIKDFFNTLHDEPVDFISHEPETGKAIITPRRMDLELNCADGQGLIDPYFASLWATDMDLKYIPCSFVVRSCFIKGNLATFDFKDYAHSHGIFKIRDRWGTEYNVDDIDILLSESQFKTHKYYRSWQEYCGYAERGHIHWGVARYNKSVDDEYVLANYQYIQALTLSSEDIHEMIQPTVDWIKQVCSGDALSTMLYSFGSKSEGVGYNSLYGAAQTIPMRAIIKNIDFLGDRYIQQKIYKNIAETINHAKLGKIWIRGNYQFMISDPVAQCQSALGLPVTGVLGRNEIWSDFWRQRTPPEEERRTKGYVVDTCRSPMIDQHEHNPMNVVVDNEEANRWFRYLNSGIIYNIYDTSCFRHEDSDLTK